MSEESELRLGMRCVQYMIFVANFMFTLVGLLLISIGYTIKAIYTDFDGFLLYHSCKSSNFAIGVGFLIVVVALFGCLGAIKKSVCLVNLYALCLLLIVFLEVAISASAYISRDHIAARLEEDMYTSMYHFNDETNFLWRASQSNLHCCGVRGPNDWGKFQSIFGNLLENATYNDAYNATPRNYIVPSSCCRNETCNTAYSLYIQGCLPRINFIFSQSALLLGVGAMCITFIQLLGAIFAHLLARSIRKLKTQVEVERNIRRQQLYEQLAQAKNAETKTTPVLYVPSTSEA